jgi:hypothetical protein
MRDLTMNEVENVSGSGAWTDFVADLRGAYQEAIAFGADIMCSVSGSCAA